MVILKDQIIPVDLIASNSNFIREMRNLQVPGDIYTHVAGVDLIRNNDGEFYVLEDNLRTPSGVSYMLENREITRRLYPNMLPKQKVLPIGDYPSLLHSKLETLSNKDNPTNVIEYAAKFFIILLLSLQQTSHQLYLCEVKCSLLLSHQSKI